MLSLFALKKNFFQQKYFISFTLWHTVSIHNNFCINKISTKSLRKIVNAKIFSWKSSIKDIWECLKHTSVKVGAIIQEILTIIFEFCYNNNNYNNNYNNDKNC